MAFIAQNTTLCPRRWNCVIEVSYFLSELKYLHNEFLGTHEPEPFFPLVCEDLSSLTSGWNLEPSALEAQSL